jgi:serine protease Do
MHRIPFFITLLLCIGIAGLLRAQNMPSGSEAAAIEKTLVEVIAGSEKSVVAIARVRRERPGETFSFDSRPDPFGSRSTPLAPPEPTDPDFIPNEYGTGVVVGRGLILTAADVLGDDSDYYVTTADRKVYKATVKAADPRSDLAVLAIEAVNLPPIRLGNADELKKGQIVISLGNPYAIARDGQASAAWGIVSNLQRKAPAVPSESDLADHPTLHHHGTLVATDAKLNLGTSGGPLLNLKGEMVGLSVALAATAGYEAAGGYAIPVDATFRRAVDTLKLGHEVEYGFLGVQPANLQPQEALADLQGIRVSQVIPGTPAARYGLKPNDVITAVDGTPIHDSDGLILNVGKLPPEAVTRLSVLRDGRPLSIDVTLSKYAVRGRKIVTVLDPPWRGLRVEYLTAVVDEEGHFRRGASGTDDAVVVTEVENNSPAAAAGLRRGMLITHVGRTPVRTPNEFTAAVARAAGPVQLRLAGDEKNPVRTVAPGT